MTKVIGGSIALYAVELILMSAGVPLLDWLAYHPLGAGWMPWQLVTQFFVEPPYAMWGVLITALVAYFVFPAVEAGLSRRRLAEAAIAAIVGGAVLPFLLDAIVWTGVVPWGRATLHGWGVAATLLITMFGLLRPDDQILLFFVLPVQAVWFVWLPPVISGLLLLSGMAAGGDVLEPARHLGAWAGVYAWWRMGGLPRWFRGRRPRGDKARTSGFRVVQGGQDDIFH